MWQAYHSVSSLDEALALLAEQGRAARIVAGGTDLIIEMERDQHPHLNTLIDITRVPGLDAITLENGIITLGPLVTHNHVLGSQLIRERATPLAQASWEVGAPQIRNRATIAGNLITASPANDTITPLIALGAELTLQSAQGKRRLPLQDFYSGFRQTVLQPDELLRAIHIPALGEGERGIFLKLGLRRAQAISVVDVAIWLKRQADGVMLDARIALGSVAPTIVTVPQAEEYLRGKELSPAVISAVARLAGGYPAPIDDVRGSAEYRSEMVKALVAKALRRLAADGYAHGLPAQPPMLWGRQGGRVAAGLPKATVHQPDSPIESRVNGNTVRISSGQQKSLLHWLREDVKLPGTKEGCAEGECGACTVFLDDVAVMACMVHAPRAHGAEVITIEGLATEDALHPIQQAFIDAAAVQCGYCTPGFLMAGAKLLDEIPQPDTEQINISISGNLCRCTGYYKILDAFRQASARKLGAEQG
ncbi:MAG: FAD binding domain-containing protein [Chloroflexi bacterium]|nr:FAD binding domain-containing protein [Chloroflexota bacterium]MCY3583409.1 FAD binding domain-containing protein [Chloroflexota bacterium]MCY3715408.1 FAD binding domain-containing protein [Chloroflexota bacterium]MDE2649617.1 FAD binding domain-containing protein [Chloroflexota bacterium]MXX50811.1 2Fe-2S iron-sulfur cluster binding domain-containing protein [Chloroflexota bacterium]